MPEVEIWDLYDKDRNLTGLDNIRGDEIPDGYYHLVVHAWIKNRKGEYLISQRSADRPTFPLKWECTGGSALKEEDSLTAALRETEEEVGIKLFPNNGRLVHSEVGRTFNGKSLSDILDVWLFDYDGPVDLGKATTKEVEQAKWMNKEEIKQIFDEGEFVETLRYFLEMNVF